MFDKNEAYNENIAPLVEQLKKACYKEKIPMFVTCAVSGDKTSTTYKNEMVSAVSVQQELNNDKIAKCVNIHRGYELCAPQDIDIIDFN